MQSTKTSLLEINLYAYMYIDTFIHIYIYAIGDQLLR